MFADIRKDRTVIVAITLNTCGVTLVVVTLSVFSMSLRPEITIFEILNSISKVK